MFGNWYPHQTLRYCFVAYNAALKDQFNARFLFHFETWKIAGCGDLTTEDR